VASACLHIQREGGTCLPLPSLTHSLTHTDDVPGECATNLLNPTVGPCTSVLQTEQFRNCELASMSTAACPKPSGAQS
jgi:hypothetical protein